MRAVILAGGLGTLLAKATTAKPMVAIGRKPLLCQTLRSYLQHGIGPRAAVAAAGRTAGRRPMSKVCISTRDDFEWRGKRHATT